jgi:hypothetical protein
MPPKSCKICGHDATFECSDCGGSTCEIHLLTCDACGVQICSDCSAFYGYGLALCETDDCSSNQKSARQTLKETYYNAKNRAWKPKSPPAQWFADYFRLYFIAGFYFAVISLVLVGIYITALSFGFPSPEDNFNWDDRTNDLANAVFLAMFLGFVMYPIWFAYIIIDLVILPNTFLTDAIGSDNIDTLRSILWLVGFIFMYIYYRALRKRRYLS